MSASAEEKRDRLTRMRRQQIAPGVFIDRQPFGREPVMDPLVVLGRELRAVLEPWCARIDATIPPPHTDRLNKTNREIRETDPTKGPLPMPRPLTGIMQLVYETGLDEAGIRRIINGTDPNPYVSLRRADALLQAAGETDAISTGRVKIRRNPNMRLSFWADRMRARGVTRFVEVFS